MPEDTKDLDIGDEIETTIGKGTHKAEIMVKTPVMGGDGKPVTIDIGDEIETTIGKGTHKAEIIGVVEVKGKGKHFIVKIDRAQYRVNAKTLTLG